MDPHPPHHLTLRLDVEVEQEDDGRWIAEITSLPGVIVYGATTQDAISAAYSLALRVLADRVEHHEPLPAQR